MDKLRSMQVFVEVVRMGSFSAAAEALGLVNSAVSRQVTELEQWLGIRLLYRTTRKLSLTAEGEQYLDRFSSLLNQVSEIEQISGRNRDTVMGNLRITTFPFMADALISPVLLDFQADYPQVNVSLHVTDELVSLVGEGFDLGIRVGHLNDSTLLAKRIDIVKMRTVASPEYLQRSGVAEHPKDLIGHNCLFDTVLDRHNRRWEFIDNGSTMTIPVDGNLNVNSGAMIVQMAVAGHGIAYLPSFFVDKDIAEGRLVEILDSYCDIHFPLSLIYPQNRQSSEPLRLMINAVIEHYNEMKPLGKA